MGNQKTSLYCLHGFRGYGEGRRRKEEGNGEHPQDRRGWKMELGEKKFCTVVKVLLDVFTFPPEEEMKAHANKPFHPSLSIPFLVLKGKEGSAETSVVQCKEMRLGHRITVLPSGFTLGLAGNLWVRQA